MRYRRAQAKGGTFLFTVNLADRSSDSLVVHIDRLRVALKAVRSNHAFEAIAMVVMPDHLHAIWQLPDGDVDCPMRWSLIKANFSRSLVEAESIGSSRAHKRERGIWQRRYWEHQIRDDDDLPKHVDYIHYNR
jgi:putative transposase